MVRHRIFDSSSAEYYTKEIDMPNQLTGCLKRLGISELYSHQGSAYQLIKESKNVVIATPTSSGKSMVYNLPVLQRIIESKESHALYLFPLKALSQDQLKNLDNLKSSLELEANCSNNPIAAVYDGDTNPYQRRKIRQNTPSILITNPEMVHLSLLPHHESWSHFFKNLEFIIVDEVHTYRGIFGSHFSWLIRRLKRVCHYYGKVPKFVLCSATIGNPKDFSEKIIDARIHVVDKSGAPQNRKNFLLLNPHDSAAYSASQLLEASMKRGLRTIVYTQSRKMTELISLWTQQRLGDLTDRLSSYRAGFLPEERREIEAKLNDGRLIGVISTSALELGIDIGDLDICILVGYPGSIMSSWQRGGRVGRGGNESAVILIASEDALDQYYMKNPDRFFEKDVESAVINPDNKTILRSHLQCAAAEIPLDRTEDILTKGNVQAVLSELISQSAILQSETGNKYYSSRKRPQRFVNLRGTGESLTIINYESGEILGEIDNSRALKECHDGAVYLHRMKTWLVQKLNLEAKEVAVSEKNVPYYTKPLTTKDTEILSIVENRCVLGCSLYRGELKVTEKVTGYQKRNKGTSKLINTIPLDLPEQVMETTGIWLVIPKNIVELLEEEKHHFMGGLHALEHLLISVFPLLILCDRNDIGGISCPQHEQTESATIFIYDGHVGGSGLSYEAFSKAEKLFTTSKEIIGQCDCENGCPACVHSPKCGSGNRPIDKLSCISLIKGIEQGVRNETNLPRSKMEAAALKKEEPGTTVVIKRGRDILPKHWGVFDLETKYSAEEVGGWHNIHKMGLSVGVVYDSLLQGFVTYFEDEADRLIDHLMTLQLVVGFNNKRFDNRVLLAYGAENINDLPTIDLLEEIKAHLGYRLSLNAIAQHTLGIVKSGDGLQALRWYHQGDFENLSKYCRKDVEITKKLFLFGLENGFFIFQNKAKKKVRLPLFLEKAVASRMNAG